MRGWEEAYWILETKERGGRSREWRVVERMGEAYWILETKERGGRSREWRVVERMGGSVLDPRDKGERRKIKGVESS